MSKLFGACRNKCMIFEELKLWVHVSRLPMPHPDNDQWKHTMFTNKSYISACHVDKILQVNVFTV